MPISAFAAAKHIGKMSDWSKSNLEIQKILYIAHMLHLGNWQKRLVQEHFQAWDLGPVIPVLYHKAKIFGADPVKNIFRSVSDLDGSQPEAKTLHSTFNIVCGHTGGQLVAITHCKYGAWYKNYQPGALHVVIPNEDIIEEFKERQRRYTGNNR